jgi:carbamoyltransferase
MYILGIHDGHNGSAILLRDGRVVAGVQEERPRGVKNAMGMPKAAIHDVLEQAAITPADVDLVALSGLHSGEYIDVDQCPNPSEQIVKWYQAKYDQTPFNLRRLIRPLVPQSIYELVKGNGIREKRMAAVTSMGFPRERIRLVEHHTAHASSAYYGWGKLDEPVLVLTNDGMGDDICATVSIGKDDRLDRIAAVPCDESVAEIYALTTFLMGMVPLEHEYKLMGIAPYASTSRSEKLSQELSGLITFDRNGGLTWMRTNGFPPLSLAYHQLEKMFRRQRFDHICGGVQLFVERFLTRWVTNAVAQTGIRKIACSGGIFMNVKANKLLLELEAVEDMFVFPSCGDETNAVGAAYWVYAQECHRNGRAVDIEPLSDLYWGRSFSDDFIEQAISEYPFTDKVKVETPQDIELQVAKLLASGRVVARCSGRMEFGARALGNRSILANPADSNVVKIINEMIKQRDFWMPFAPSVAAERARDYIRKPKDIPAPYMTLCFDSVPKKVSVFAAAVHPYDGTARPQEVTEEHNPGYHRLIKYFGELTGEQIILNTSFNLHGFPVVYTPQQALKTLDESGLEHLAIGNFLITKKDYGCRTKNPQLGVSRSF